MNGPRRCETIGFSFEQRWRIHLRLFLVIFCPVTTHKYWVNGWASLWWRFAKSLGSHILLGVYRTFFLFSMESLETRYFLQFFDKKDSRFSYLHKTLNASYIWKASVHSAPVISVEDEQLLLGDGVLWMDNLTSLLRMVLYFVSLHCCIRGGQVQLDLSVDKFVRIPTDVSQHVTDNTMNIQNSFQRIA